MIKIHWWSVKKMCEKVTERRRILSLVSNVTLLLKNIGLLDDKDLPK